MYRTDVRPVIKRSLASQGRLWQNTSDMSRWVRFLLAIAIGGLIGVVYGWFINPVEYTDTAPAKMRVDYKTDYVLMVSEAFKKDGDTALAVERLAFLGGKSPDVVVFEAITFGEEKGYTEADLSLMKELADELEIFQKVRQPPDG
jgi:hypothetical protein